MLTRKIIANPQLIAINKKVSGLIQRWEYGESNIIEDIPKTKYATG